MDQQVQSNVIASIKSADYIKVRQQINKVGLSNEDSSTIAYIAVFKSNKDQMKKIAKLLLDI